MDEEPYADFMSPIIESAGSKRQSSVTDESESNMEFTVISSPGVADGRDCIYAVVSKEVKRKSSNYEGADKVQYAKVGLGGSIRGEPSSSSNITTADNNSNNSDNSNNISNNKNNKKSTEEVYATLDDVTESRTNLKEQVPSYDTFTIKSGFSGKVDGISHRYKFPSVFLGSMVVDLEKLQRNKDDYLLECIQSVAAQNSEATTMTLRRVDESTKTNGSTEDVMLSKNRGMNVILVLEGGHVKAVEKKNGLIRLDIQLSRIRMWGKGKGELSREFAIISQDPSTMVELCRVFLCEVYATTVVSIFRDVCSQLALKRKDDAAAEEQLNNGDSKLKKAKSILSVSSHSTVRSNKSEGALPSGSSLKDVTACRYLGMIEVDKPQGTKVVERAMNLVHTYVSKELWQPGNLMATPDGIYFISDGSLGLSCPNASLTFVGPSLKHNNLVGIIVKKNNGIFVHVFSVEEDICIWFENVKFICKLHSSKFDKSVSSTLNKRSQARNY